MADVNTLLKSGDFPQIVFKEKVVLFESIMRRLLLLVKLKKKLYDVERTFNIKTLLAGFIFNIKTD